MVDLNTLVPADSKRNLVEADLVADRGEILAFGATENCLLMDEILQLIGGTLTLVLRMCGLLTWSVLQRGVVQVRGAGSARTFSEADTSSELWFERMVNQHRIASAFNPAAIRK
jgi:hypothetical protein